MIEIKQRTIKSLPTSRDDLIISTGENACFVCDLPFRKKQRKINVGKDKDSGAELYRHEKRNSNSPQWKKKFGSLNH